MGKRADLRYERRFWKEGVHAVAGCDEAGVGPMAGPVVAAAVLFEPEVFIKGRARFKAASARAARGTVSSNYGTRDDGRASAAPGSMRSTASTSIGRRCSRSSARSQR